MILNLPKLGPVQFSDELTPDQLNSELERLAKKYEFELPRSELSYGEMGSRAIKRGAKQLGSTFGDLIPAMGASALGFDEYAAKQMEEAKATQDEINRYYAPQYRSTSDVKGISDFPGFALETIAEQVPNIATSLIPGGIGGTIARRAGVAAAERAAMPLIESGATAAELARVAGRKGAEYATRGQNAGVFLGSYAQNAPEIFQNIYEKTGEMAPGAAMLFGTASAALDSVLPAQLLKSVTGPVKVGIVEKLLERSGMDKGLLRSVTAGMLKGSGAESLTEGMQEAISIAAENFVDKHESVFGSKEWNRIMESAVRGAVAGGAFGGVGGGTEAYRAGQERKGQYAQAMGQRQQRLLAGEVGRQSADIEAFGADQQQMQLPGFEIGPASGLLPPTQPAPPVLKEPKGKQLGLFGEDGLPTKEAEASKLRGDKAVANQERLAQQRESAEVKAAQAKIKAAISELINTPTDLVGLAKQPSPLSQTIAQARGDLDALAGKRGPKAEVIPEPRVVQKATPLTPQQLPTTINDEVLKGLGIGHTALLRKNKLLDGKDISNPADAAEVKRILEAYAEDRSEPIRQKIEAYLSRPEFQGAQNVAGLNAEPSGGSPSVDSGSDLVTPAETDAGLERSGDVLAEQDAGDIDAREEQPAPTVTLPPEVQSAKDLLDAIDKGGVPLNPGKINAIARDLGLEVKKSAKPEETIARLREAVARATQPMGFIDTQLDEGIPSGIETSETIEAAQEGQTQSVAGEPLSKKAATDEKKAEQGASADTQERRTFVRSVDKLVDNIITSEIRKAEKAANLNTGEVQLPTTFVGMDIHDLLRLPRLLSEFLRLQEVIPKIEEAPQRAKNEKALKQIAEGINRSGVFAEEAMRALNGGYRNDPEALLGVINKAGTESLADFVSEKVEAAKQEVAARRKEDQPPEPKKSTNQLSKTRLKRAINEVYHNWTKSNKQRDAFYEMVNQGKALEAIDQVLESLDPESRQNLKSELNFIYGQEMFLPKAIGPALDTDGIALAKKGNFKDLLSHVINKTDNKLVRQVLRKIQSLGIAPKIVIGKVEGNRAGSYDPATNTITLDPEFGLNHHTIIHETVHAAISHVLRSPNNKLTQAFVKFFEQIKNQMGSAYGGQDIQEFASELVGNPEFQALLKTIKAPRSENMFVNIMRAIGEFLGFRSAYTEGMKFINDAIDISSKVEVTPANKMFLSMGSAVNSAFNTVGQIGQNMPSLAGQTLEDTKNLFSNVKDFGWMKTAMGLLRLDNINTLYGKELPSIQKLLDALELRNGMQERRISDINKNYKEFTKIAQDHKQDMSRMNDMAIDARLYEVDPLDANFKTTPANAAQYNRLRNIYTSLDPKVQKVYKEIRNFYMKSLDEYEALLVGDPKKGIPGMLSPTLAAKLAVEFATRKRLAAYVPFLRNGDFWLEFPDPASGERTAMAFESIRERQQFIDSQLTPNKIPSKSYRNLQSITFDPRSVLPTSFIGKLMTDLRAANATQEQLDAVYQAHLMFFPAESIAKQFLKSKNVLGMERDIVKGYGTTAIKWARKLTNSEYAPKIDTALSEIEEQANNVNRLDVTAAAENILEQKAFLHNPTFNSFTQAATTLSYFEFIAGNISSALVNITALPMLVWPMLSGKFGFNEARIAMTAASRVAINGMENNPKYKNLYKEMMDHGQLEHTMAREVLEGRRQSTDEFTGLKGRILDGLSIPFAATERYNRATTAIAAYDLARQSGMSEKDSINYAITTTKDIHTSGLAATAPKWMQNPVGRVFFTFKSFVWNSAFIMARAFHQAFKGETTVIQHAARRQLIGTYGMVMAFGGVKGMPFYGATSTFITMLAALFGDDDEPFDFNEEMRDFFGELGYKGAFNYVTNLELSNRVGIATDLIFRDDPRGVAEHGYVLSAMQQMFGPAGSYAVSVGNGVKMMKEGHVERGIEAMVPSFVRNGMKGMRYMSEGALTLKGDPVDEDINAYNGLMQAIGFSPADLSSNYEKTSAAKSYEKEVGARRVQLLNLHDMAKTAGDMELMSKTKDAIQEFNSKHSKDKITGDTLRRSESSRKAAEKNMINGVTFNKKLRGEIEEKFFED
jgi:hypothetical protein